MVSVVGRAVDDANQAAGNAIVTIVDGDGPDVDEHIEGQVEDLVKGEEEGVDVIWEALQEAVDGMEGVAGEGGRDLPNVVWLVKHLV